MMLGLGAAGATVQADGTCLDKTWWYRLTNPSECWTFPGGSPPPQPISSTVVNTPPPAPTTGGAMTTPGVWTPDYAMERMQRDQETEVRMRQAEADARNQTGPYSGGSGLPFENPTGPDPNACDSLIYRAAHVSECGGLGLECSVGGVSCTTLALAAGVGLLALVMFQRRT